MTTLRLTGSLTSPYVRFVRVVLAELAIEHAFQTTLPFAKMTAEQARDINEANPLMKIPILETAAGPLFDSRVIVEWLMANHTSPGEFGDGFPENLSRLNALTTTYGILESAVLRFLVAASHPETDMASGYMARSLERIDRGLAWLDRCGALGQQFGPPEALACCCVEWLSRRNICETAPHERLCGMVAGFADRPSLRDTRIPEDA